MIKQYILWNWGMILILAAFAVSLKETVFLDKTTIRRMYILIVAVFLLSLVVFAEFYLTDLGGHANARLVLMAVRYSATPFISASAPTACSAGALSAICRLSWSGCTAFF